MNAAVEKSISRMPAGTLQTHWFPYGPGRKKSATVWLPPGYVQGKRAYGVLYMTDGQNLFDRDAPYGGWCPDQAVMQLPVGMRGFIIVGIDNGNKEREIELTPDLGPVPTMVQAMSGYDFSRRKGAQFARFVTRTVMPYIETYYTVLTGRAHTAVAGSSSGGLEAFYIGLENRDKFSYIAALSPAFVLFEEKTWKNYFNRFDFTKENYPQRIYMYNGNGDLLEKMLYAGAVQMKQQLLACGFPPKSLKFETDMHARHNEQAWRNYFPRALAWLLEKDKVNVL